MRWSSQKKRNVLILGIIVLIALNLYTFVVAYPETYTPSSGISNGPILAKDFSAYYIGSWKLWNDPAQIYNMNSSAPQQPAILPYPQGYKYLPSFLVLTSPLLLLDYQDALLAFDIVQFLFLPFIAFFIYKLMNNKPLALTFIVLLVALLLPFPTENWGASPSYYWQWGEGQAKVAVLFLLTLSFYLGSKGKTVLSGIVFALGFFDPRFGLLAIPLFLLFNRANLKTAIVSTVAALAVSNMMLLYPPMGYGFLSMVFFRGVPTPVYYYAYIPLLTLLALMLINLKELVALFDYKEIFAKFTGKQKQEAKKSLVKN
ncbi:MAG: hypothetical protein NWF01_02685 [Candidatus Bathyarchaeota archaeon]|nr:hypothetical protein [Candidatus Bathyarchaeota archaeon]